MDDSKQLQRLQRAARRYWGDGDFHEGTGGNPNILSIVEITHTYDKASKRLSRNIDNPTLAWPHSNATFDYDDLHRLISAGCHPAPWRDAVWHPASAGDTAAACRVIDTFSAWSHDWWSH